MSPPLGPTGQHPILDPHAFCSQLARLHKSTAGTSSPTNSTGKFGFGVTTCNGNIEQFVAWEERWDVFFAKGLRWMTDLYSRLSTTTTEMQAETEELKTAVGKLCDVVIPHLLGPERLKDGITGEPVKPCLVHGDLWIGNTGTDTQTKKPVVFDPAACYAHNEYELGNWVPERCGFGGLEGEFVREYRRLYPPAEPVEEFEERVRLYSL